MLLSDAIDGFLFDKSVGCSPHTISDYRHILRQWASFLVDDLPLETISADHVRRYLFHLRVERKLAPKSVKNAHTGISAFFSWAEEELQIEHQVRGKVKSPKANAPEIIPLCKADIQLLLKACERTAGWESDRRRPADALRPSRNRDKALVLFLLDTGLRVQELCDLRVGDVDMQSGAVIVHHGKGDKERIVYAGHVARTALWRYLAKRRFKEKDDPLFATNKHGPMDRHTVRKLLTRAGGRAGLSEPAHPHRFRHTFAINYLRNGGDIFTLQRLLGHSSLDMVRRYLSIAQVDLAEAHRRASPADNWRLG